MAGLQRFAVVFALFAAFTATGSARAQVRVGLYPPQGSDREYLKDLQSVLESALTLARHRGVISGRSVLLPEACPSPASTPCLAALAKGGAVLLARISMKAGTRLATLVMIDSQGRTTPPVSFPFDPEFQDIRLADSALKVLEGHWTRLADPAVPTQPAPPPAAPQIAATEPAPQGLPPSAAAAQVLPESSATETAEASPRAWMGRAGPWIAGAGALLLAGGAAAGYADRRINDRLTDAYRKGTLAPSDGSAYAQVEVLNVVANSLFVVGGLASATGLCFWGLAPEAGPVAGGAQLGFSGRF